jgi:hypothetical protein
MIACNELEWHIARLSKTSSNACFAQQAITKKKCTSKTVQGNRSTVVLTYTGMMVHYKKYKEERMQFYFYNDDKEKCVKGTRWRWIKSRPNVLNIWPVKIGTNLTRTEILALENASFQLPQHTIIFPRRLFRGEVPFDMDSYSTPACPDDHPNIRSSKDIQRNKKAPTTKHSNNCTSALTLKGRL